MNTTRRRCYSEQVPPPTKRAIPPHKAFKLRQAQLREAHKQCLPLPELDKKIRIETSHKDEKEVVAQDRQSSAPIPLQQQDNQTSKVQNESHSLLSRNQDHERNSRQDRLSGYFPSIDAIIAESKGRDNRRQLGETEFYEHTGDDRVIRRRSMMRTVNKDDCLVGRGANPRTGLITPDWNSVTSSLDNDHGHFARRDRPSAQWRLDGDAWVSVLPQEGLLESPTEEQTRSEQPTPHFDNVDSASSSRKTSNKWPTTALTEKNLRAFSHQSQLHQPADKPVQHDREPIEEIKIKRKPVGSPSAAPFTANSTREAMRSVSHDTVVHSPGAKPDFPIKRQGYPEYYSPESVGAGLSKSDASSFPQRARNGSPFLGVPVEPPNMVLQPRGFASKVTNRNQLQQSLRTSSGPYPSHPSSQQAMSGKVDHLLQASQFQHEYHKRGLYPLEGLSVPRQRAPRAYRPDDVTSFRLTEAQSRHQDLPRFGPQNGKKYPQHGWSQVVDSQEGHRSPDSSNNAFTQRMPNTTNTTTNIRTPTSGRRAVRDVLPCHHDYASSARDTFLDHNCIMDDGIERSPGPVGDHKSRGIRSEKRPQLGPREQGMLRVPKIRIEETDMVHRSHSNTIGTAKMQQDEGDAKRATERLTEGTKTLLSLGSTASSEAVSPITNDQLILYDADRFDTPKQEYVTRIDHTSCCPECCVKFDCHEGCLGHVTPSVSDVGSETSSLVSMGVFDANFETSVKAVNKALLTPMEKGNGRLAKVRTIFGWKPGTSSPTETSPRSNTMKRTLHKESLSQKVNVGIDRSNRPVIKGPLELGAQDAKTAAIRALDAEESSKENLGHCNKARIKTKDKTTKTGLERKTVEAPTEANEGRRVTGKARKASKTNVSKTQDLPANSSETTLVQSGSEDEKKAKEAATDDSIADDHRTETMSMVDRVSIFIRRGSSMVRPKCINLNSLTDPVLLSYARSVALRVKDMTVTVADTAAVVVGMVLEYNRSGKLMMPAGTSTNELAGNLLRSVVYLMISACVYAMLVKAGRFILAVLRIVLFPVRVCAWIIG